MHHPEITQTPISQSRKKADPRIWPHPGCPDKVERIATLGAGTMGGGWTAAFAARGIAVNVWDPDPETEPRVRAYVEQAFPMLDLLRLLV